MLALCVRTSSTSGGDAQAGGFPQTDLCCACRGRRRRPQAETAAGPSHSAGFVPRRACRIQICAPVMATRDSTSRPTQPFGNGFCGLSDARVTAVCSPDTQRAEFEGEAQAELRESRGRLASERVAGASRGQDRDRELTAITAVCRLKPQVT